MAQRRMLSKKITHTDAFMDMPEGAKVLYFYLVMEADDDGFVDSPKRIMNMLGSAEDDYKILVAKKFILIFESGICVIKHWLIHNLIRGDRYTGTQWIKEKEMLKIDDKNRKYSLDKGENNVIPNGNQMATQYRLGKVRLGKVIKDAPSNEGIVESLLEEKGGIQYDFQYLGLEIFEKTGAPIKKKGECIRLAKLYPNLVNLALSFCLDYPNPALKWKMFLWRLNSLIKEKEIKK